MDYFAAVRAFVRAAELKSFSKTANELAVKTSTISRYVSELESDLGIALFNRSTRGLVLTEGGRLFREHALLALQALDDAREVTSSLNRTPQGALRVTIPPPSVACISCRICQPSWPATPTSTSTSSRRIKRST
ncbi:LysR family transcriptional regulator [Paraburkholderia bannensis]|uniref:LysR family transcriptional regulator n=1 Tax=Paraburkholderia bannensis TaxID=765414 RepID=UPI002ABE723F|nr:LysR family transcriptional regulator [Paraburkholderia bannensis]